MQVRMYLASAIREAAAAAQDRALRASLDKAE
jgi:hypothetical protein